jgi:hypothetical protein
MKTSSRRLFENKDGIQKLEINQMMKKYKVSEQDVAIAIQIVGVKKEKVEEYLAFHKDHPNQSNW